MKSARWGIAWAYATAGDPLIREVASHVFVDDSSAPICQPHVEGTPGTLFSNERTQHCRTCADLVVHASWSVTSCNRQRLWVLSVGFTTKPAAEGFAVDNVDALNQAHAALERLLPSDAPTIFRRVGDAAAERVARERRAEARSKKMSEATGAQVVEYVYRHDKVWPSWFASAFEWKTYSAKVLRKTAKKVFVECKTLTYTTAGGVMVLHTYALDRAELERAGKCRGWTTNPHPPADGRGAAPGWAEVLGVSLPCTLAQAKRAFRSAAKTAHPDSGGSDEAFRRVTAAFAAASQHLGGAS